MQDMCKVMAKDDVNTGRQIEFDYMKGIFMLFIFLVHAYQATGSEENTLISCIYVFATMSGAAIYIFVMGFGVPYSTCLTPSHMVKRGIRLVIYQYLSNLLYVIALTIPYLFVRNTLSVTGAENYDMFIWVYSQFINIFFISGVIYLVLALLEKLRLPVPGYAALAVFVAAIAPVIYGTEIDIPGIGYVAALIIGEAPYVSFTPLYFLPYALIGVATGKAYRKIREKSLFYKRLIPICVIIILLWWVSIYIRFRLSPDEWGFVGDVASFESVMDEAYSTPDLWHVIASLSHIGLFAGVLYLCEEHRKRKKSGSEERGLILSQFLYYNSNISKYYALHLAVDLFAVGLHGYLDFSAAGCFLLAVISMVVTEALVRMINRINIKKS